MTPMNSSTKNLELATPPATGRFGVGHDRRRAGSPPGLAWIKEPRAERRDSDEHRTDDPEVQLEQCRSDDASEEPEREGPPAEDPEPGPVRLSV